MKSISITVMTCAACFLMTGWIVAQENPPEPGAGGKAGGAESAAMWGGIEGEGMRVGMVLERILADPDLVSKVGLTGDQVKTLTTAISDLKKERIRVKADMELAAVEQADAMAQTNVDEKAVLKLVDKVGDLRTKLGKALVSELLLVKKTLTPDQVKKIKEVTKELRKERQAEAKEPRKQMNKERRADKNQKDTEQNGPDKENNAAE